MSKNPNKVFDVFSMTREELVEEIPELEEYDNGTIEILFTKLDYSVIQEDVVNGLRYLIEDISENL